MKPRVVKYAIDQYRQWAVFYLNSMSFFPSWDEAIRYALTLEVGFKS